MFYAQLVQLAAILLLIIAAAKLPDGYELWLQRNAECSVCIYGTPTLTNNPWEPPEASSVYCSWNSCEKPFCGNCSAYAEPEPIHVNQKADIDAIETLPF